MGPLGSRNVRWGRAALWVALIPVPLAQAGAEESTDRFHNLSSRARVGACADLLICGLVVETRPNVLVRGIGPGLVPFGLNRVLASPRL